MLGSLMSAIDLAGIGIAAAATATAAGAAAQAVTGYGFSLVAAPVFVLLVGPLQAVRLTNVFALLVNLLLLAREHRGLRAGRTARLLIPAVIVTPPTAWAVHRSDPAVLSIVVGLVVLACALALVFGGRDPRFSGRKSLFAAGATSAAMNTTSGVGGPAVAMYAINADWSVEHTRPTLALFFVGLNVLSLSALGLPKVTALVGTALAVATFGGFVAGMSLLRRLSPASVARSVLLLAVAGGLAAILRGALAV